MKSKLRFKQLASVKIGDSRSLVISSVNDSADGFTIAQQLNVQERGKTISVFLKGGIQIPDVQSLVDIRDAINVALARISDQGNIQNDENEWDKNNY